MINRYIFGYKCSDTGKLEVVSNNSILKSPDNKRFDWGNDSLVEDRITLAYAMLDEFFGKDIAKKYYLQFSEEIVANYNGNTFSITFIDLEKWLKRKAVDGS